MKEKKKETNTINSRHSKIFFSQRRNDQSQSSVFSAAQLLLSYMDATHFAAVTLSALIVQRKLET